MKDADFAALLGSIGVQGALQSITYANNEFGPESCLALSGVMLPSTREHNKYFLVADGQDGREHKANPKQGRHRRELAHLESLKLCNVQVKKKVKEKERGEEICLVTQELLDMIDDATASNGLRRLSLSKMDLSQLNLTSLCNQFAWNPALLELDLSYSKLLPDQLRCILESLATEYS